MPFLLAALPFSGHLLFDLVEFIPQSFAQKQIVHVGIDMAVVDHFLENAHHNLARHGFSAVGSIVGAERFEDVDQGEDA